MGYFIQVDEVTGAGLPLLEGEFKCTLTGKNVNHTPRGQPIRTIHPPPDRHGAGTLQLYVGVSHRLGGATECGWLPRSIAE